MSWPADKKPRYKIAAITGASVPERWSAHSNNSVRGYVYDRARCFEIMAVVGSTSKTGALVKARRIAKELEAGRDPGLLPAKFREHTTLGRA